jgi:hypothetical protein
MPTITVSALHENPELPGIRFRWVTGEVASEQVLGGAGRGAQRELWVREDGGREERFTAPASASPVRAGHRVTVIVGATPAWPDGRVLSVVNHATGGAETLIPREIRRVASFAESFFPITLVLASSLVLLAGCVGLLLRAPWAWPVFGAGAAGRLLGALAQRAVDRTELVAAQVRQIAWHEGARLHRAGRRQGAR